MKAAKYLLPFVAAALLGACSTVGGMPRGQQTADYKMEAAGGVQAEVGRSAANSSYRYGFGIRLKNAPRVASVKIERTRGGELGVVFDDSRHPTTATKAWQRHADGTRSYLYNNGDGSFDWIGQTAARKLTPQQAPWLYQAGTTHQQYRITIRDLQGRETVLVQDTAIPPEQKQAILQLWRTPSRSR